MSAMYGAKLPDCDPSKPIVDSTGVCDVCTKPTRTRCARCKLTFFCSTECQKWGHRYGHNLVCNYHVGILTDMSANSASSNANASSNKSSPLSGDGRVCARSLPSLPPLLKPEELGKERMHAEASIAEDIFHAVNSAFSLRSRYSHTASIGIVICDKSTKPKDGAWVAVQAILSACGSEEARTTQLLRHLKELAAELLAYKMKFTTNQRQEMHKAHTYLILTPVVERNSDDLPVIFYQLDMLRFRDKSALICHDDSSSRNRLEYASSDPNDCSASVVGLVAAEERTIERNGQKRSMIEVITPLAAFHPTGRARRMTNAVIRAAIHGADEKK